MKASIVRSCDSIMIYISDTCICDQEDKVLPNDNGSTLVILNERVCIGTALSPCECGENGCRVCI